MGHSKDIFTAERAAENGSQIVTNKPVSKSLYNIRTDHLSLIEAIEEADGELTPEIEQALALTEEEFQSKALSYGFVIKSFDDTADMVDKEIKRLKLLLKKAVNRAELFKTRLDEAMRQFGVEKITSPTLTLSYRKSKAVEITDETLITDEFKIPQEPLISKTLIKAALDEGVEVAGAHFVENKSLQIK